MATDSVRDALKDEEVDNVDTRRHKPGKPESSLVPPGEPAGMETGMRILSYLASGLILYGGLGWLGDKFLGTEFLLPLGLIIGLGLAMFVIIKRYNHDPGDKPKK
ncbi:hypothetical protein [Raineyella fluvialis]|uniref:F0F1-ATPase subunit Ca2+/Mg2+ transporter n=1 Tax=Raineyella fluvialis TaxID=2662261 RepID=A0A5Q2FDJ6_9ACTN|nr:hypothetical protein [Raineyella fluvialis]QGF24451.1 hypothetical protein Rai3103_13225 [Raineyella fluvialis]